MKVTFFTLKSKNKVSSIYVRFADSKRFDKKAKTGLSVKFEDWSKIKEQVKLTSNNSQKNFINVRLREIENYLLEQYNVYFNSKKNIGDTWLKDKISEFLGRTDKNELYKIYFLDWIQKFVDEAPNRMYKGKIISPLTIKQYQTTLNKLKAFEVNNNVKLKFENIDLAFHTNFIFYCKKIENLGNNSIGGHIKNVKMWCRNIEIEGYNINSQYKHKSFATLSNETNDIYFTEIEINQIFNYDFSYNSMLSNARDLLIIGLRTGLRVSDFMRLTELNIKNERINIVTKKTNTNVTIPMHLQVKQILALNNGILPHSISDQKFNEYIKQISLAAGIKEVVSGAKINPDTKRKENGYYAKWELVTSHICRRTFATLLYGRLLNKEIMAITTHTTEAQFLKYIKTTNDEYATILENHWKVENEKI